MENQKPTLRPEDEESLKRNFSYHAPNKATIELHEETREKYRLLAEYLYGTVGVDNKEMLLAMVRLEESLMWANAGIARGGYDIHKLYEDKKEERDGLSYSR